MSDEINQNLNIMQNNINILNHLIFYSSCTVIRSYYQKLLAIEVNKWNYYHNLLRQSL